MLNRLLGVGHQPTDDVWFSRNICNNQLQYWMLVVRDRKLELMRSADGTYTFIYSYEPGWAPEREQQGRSSRPRGRYGNGYDCWILVHIGWTRLSEKEINRCFDSTRIYYSAPLFWTQCQEFLHRFADGLMDRYDLHWRFFLDNVNIRCRSVPELPPPPAALVQRIEEQRNFTRRIENLNLYQAGVIRSQQQNIALNNQIMQNNQFFGMGGSGS